MNTEEVCQVECVKENRCLSYSFGSTTDKKRFSCQLSDSDRFVGQENFTEDNEVLYRGIQVIKSQMLRLHTLNRKVRKGLEKLETGNETSPMAHQFLQQFLILSSTES